MIFTLLITLFKILSIVFPIIGILIVWFIPSKKERLLKFVIYFTIEKTKIYVNKILNILSIYRFFNTNYDQISSMYFLFGLITGFIGMLSTVYLKLSITGTFDIFTYNP